MVANSHSNLRTKYMSIRHLPPYPHADQEIEDFADTQVDLLNLPFLGKCIQRLDIALRWAQLRFMFLFCSDFKTAVINPLELKKSLFMANSFTKVLST